MTMFCYKCGKQLPDDAVFCSACGTAVQTPPVSQPAPEPTTAVAEPLPKPEKVEKLKKPKKERKPAGPKKKKILKILGAVVLLAAVIGGVCLFLSQHDVADIPDPEHYFGTIEDVTVEDDYFFYEVQSEVCDFRGAMQAYCDLLTSEYPFEIRQEFHEDDGDFVYQLRYNGTGVIWDRDFYEIKIDYYGNNAPAYPDVYTGRVYIESEKNFHIAPLEQCDASIFEREFTDAALYFAESGNSGALSHKGGEISDDYANGQDYASEASSGDAVAALLEEYFEESLTAKGQFELLGQKRFTNDGREYGYYWFDFVSRKLDGFSYSNSTFDFKIGSCELMYAYYEQQDGSLKIYCWYSKDLDMRKSDLIPTMEEEPAQTASSSSEKKENDSEDKETESGWEDCPSCYGGNCTACNGRGGKDSYSPGLPREWDPCWKCHGSGDCSKCGGFGKVLA